MRRRGSLAPTVAPNMARSFTPIMLPVMMMLKTRMKEIIKGIALPCFEDGRKNWQKNPPWFQEGFSVQRSTKARQWVWGRGRGDFEKKLNILIFDWIGLGWNVLAGMGMVDQMDWLD